MQCDCGFTLRHDRAPPDNGCLACGKEMRRDADDFLLHGAEGLISASRSGQVTMARAVEKVLQTKNALLVEGPVGVGKSYAYLLPALLSGKRTVVSTAQKALQSQLAYVDGPKLVKAVRADFPKASVSLIKGKSNYGCLMHVGQTSDVPEYATWLRNSPDADLSGYTGRRPAKMYDSTAEGCLGTKCPQEKDCAYRKTRAKSLEASVLIVNHALVAFDLRFGPMKLFGAYDNLIVDEAHKAPASFRGAFEENISSKGAIRIVKKLDELRHVQLPVDSVALDAAWTAAFQRTTHLDGAIPPDPFGSAGEDLEGHLSLLAAFADKNLGALNRAHLETSDDFENPAGLELDDFSAVAALARATHKTLDALKLLRDPGQNMLLTVERHAGATRAKATPISVGAMVGEKLGMIPSLVFTSATMTTNGSFSDFSRQLGLSRLTDETLAGKTLPPVNKAGNTPAPEFKVKTVAELVVESPFDLKAQGAFLYMPRHVKAAVAVGQGTDEAREEYLDSIATEVLALVRASAGNALVLFTATSDLRAVHQRLEAEEASIPWLVQDVDSGQGAEAVMKQFHVTPGAVILGLKSFWEGVSVEGDKLWLVIVTKLPFPNPSDPLHKAQAAQMEKELTAQGVPKGEQGFAVFRRLSLPPMLTDIRQGAGRLVRTTTDRGVLAILDSRMWTGKTGVMPLAAQKAPRGYGITIIEAAGYSGNWTSDFAYVAAKFTQWRK